MEIVVLVKPVPEAETRLRPNASGTDYEIEAVKWVLAGYDESAVEQALLLKEAAAGSTVRVVSFGPGPRTEEVLRNALALGADQATWVEPVAGTVVDPLVCARALADTLRGHLPDLILAGKQSGDDESGIVPSAVGGFLDIPDFGSVVDLRWDPARSAYRLQRATESGTDSWEAPPPVVIGLQQAWNDPRTAKLPNILKSRRAPITKVVWPGTSDAGPASPTAVPTAFRLPPTRTGASFIEYTTPAEAAAKLVKILREEAKVFP